MTPSRRAATSTWFSTTMGPEATIVSGAAAGGAVGGRSGAGAAATTEGSFALLQPKQASASTATAATYSFIFFPSPADPQPQPGPEPHCRTPENDPSRWLPSSRYLAAS